MQRVLKCWWQLRAWEIGRNCRHGHVACEVREGCGCGGAQLRADRSARRELGGALLANAHFAGKRSWELGESLLAREELGGKGALTER
jgi:hypothetical protein